MDESSVDDQADNIDDRKLAFMHYLQWRWAECVRAAGLLHPEVTEEVFKEHPDFRFHARLPDGRCWGYFVALDVVKKAMEDHANEDDVPAVVMALHAKQRRPRWLGAKRSASYVAKMVASRLNQSLRQPSD